MTSGETRSPVSTHILDTSRGRPAPGVPVTLSVRPSATGEWTPLGASRTDADGRCKDLPVPPEGTTQVRLVFDTATYFRTATHDRGRTGPSTPAEAEQDAPRARDSGDVFFPEVTLAFSVTPGEHYHVPLLLNPFGYSVYRGS